MAKHGLNDHCIDHVEHDRVEDRAFVGAITQSMIKIVWVAHFEADEEVQNAGDFDSNHAEENVDDENGHSQNG